MTRREREITDENEIKDLLEGCEYLHLGLVDKGAPYVVPLNYGVDYVGDKTYIYLHGANTGRKLDIIRENSICCFTMERNVESFEGKVACQYGMIYECLMGTGNVYIVEKPQEKIHGLEVLMKTQTGKDDFKFDERLVSIVSVMRIDVDSISAKRRPRRQDEQ